METVAAEPTPPQPPVVVIETSKGAIEVTLWEDKAPTTVSNFLAYVDAGFYDGTIFHRVMPGFVVQGGGYTETIEERETFPPIINESGNGLQNLPMTIAMARYDDPNSATNQFYFNLAANSSLDPNSRSWGYAVFGQVTKGLIELTGVLADTYQSDEQRRKYLRVARQGRVQLAPALQLAMHILERRRQRRVAGGLGEALQAAEQGDVIKVSTADGSYLERASK